MFCAEDRTILSYTPVHTLSDLLQYSMAVMFFTITSFKGSTEGQTKEFSVVLKSTVFNCVDVKSTVFMAARWGEVVTDKACSHPTQHISK